MSKHRHRYRSRNSESSGCVGIVLLMFCIILISLVVSAVRFVIHHWWEFAIGLIIVVAVITFLVLRKWKLKKRRTVSFTCPKCSRKTIVKFSKIAPLDVQCESCGATIHVNLHEWSTDGTTLELPSQSDELSRQYFTLTQEIIDSRAHHEYSEALEKSLKCIEILPSFVREYINKFGEWNIPMVPCIIYSCIYLKVIPDEVRLQKVRSIVLSVPELENWISEIDGAVETIPLVHKLYSFLGDNPGFLQKKLGKTLQENGHEIADILRYAEQMGVVQREREGKTYRVYHV